MRKTSTKANWFGLSPEKIATLETWLFEDELTYDVAHRRAMDELGFTGSRTSLQRFYRNKSRERFLENMEESAAHVGDVAKASGKEGMLLNSGMKLLAQKFMELVLENGRSEMIAVAKLLLQSEANENYRQQNEIQRESMEVRKRRLDFDLTAWQYNTVEQCLNYLPELNEILKEREEAADVYHENKRMNRIRRRLFGQDIPGPAPENDEEAQALKEARDKWGHLWQRAYEDSLRRIKLRKQYGTPDEPEPAASAAAQPAGATAGVEKPPLRLEPGDGQKMAEKNKLPESPSEPVPDSPVSPGQPSEPSPARKWENHEPATRFPFNRPSTRAKSNDQFHQSP